jgi:aspartate aminotransferase
MKEKGFSKLIEAVEPSQTLAITSKAKAMRAAGKDVVGFGAGEPDFDTPENIKEAARRALAAGFTKYTPPVGTVELREAITAKLERENGLRYSPDQIVISSGAKHSLYNAVRVLCNPGDEFIIFTPHWVTYPPQVIMAGGKPVYVTSRPEDGYRIDSAKVRGAITPRTRAIILNSPNNPSGWVASMEELVALAELAVEHDLYIISDEIYEKIIYPPAVHYSVASLGEEVKERTIVVNGVSKAYAMTGWRIGYLAAAVKVAKLAGRLQSHCTSNPNSIAQAASVEALNGDQRPIGKMVEEFRKRRDYLISRIEAIAALRCYTPRGAFYAFPDISSLKMGSVAFAEELLEKSLVAVVPGKAFGCDDHIRISYALSMDSLSKGMDRIEEFVGSLTP